MCKIVKDKKKSTKLKNIYIYRIALAKSSPKTATE
jgi:hypothetical protein